MRECPAISYVSFLADISKSLESKRKRLESFTNSSIRASNKKVEAVWSTQRGERFVNKSQNLLCMYNQLPP